MQLGSGERPVKEGVSQGRGGASQGGGRPGRTGPLLCTKGAESREEDGLGVGVPNCKAWKARIQGVVLER